MKKALKIATVVTGLACVLSAGLLCCFYIDELAKFCKETCARVVGELGKKKTDDEL